MENDEINSYISDANTFFKREKYDRAVSLLNEVLRLEIDNKDALELLEQCKKFVHVDPVLPPDPSRGVSNFFEEIQSNRKFNDKIECINTFPEKDAKYDTLKKDLPKTISDYLQKYKIRLYTHQCQVIEAIRQEKNVMIFTPTASGKTLAFALPIFEYILQNKDATALFLYPTIALSNDQLKTLKNLENETKIQVTAATYYGPTPQDQRMTILKNSKILLSNPDMMHYHLGDRGDMDKFLSNLKFIVIDEAHVYKGVFGAHVSLLIRRIRRKCKDLGSSPLFVVATATIGNPQEFVTWLTGLPFVLINKSGSEQGKKHFILYNPFKSGDAPHLPNVCADLMLQAINNDLQILCFAQTRYMAEHISDATQNKMRITGKNPNLISSYRAGYSPEDRKIIENKLKDRKILGCSSTNALELGIDIGSLDVVILGGYPGSITSTWQQSGRAGRKNLESIVIFVASQAVVDQFFMAHPKDFFKCRSEEVIITSKNEYITHDHLICAARELPLSLDKDTEYFGSELEGILQEMVQSSDLSVKNHLFYPKPNYRASFSIRSNSFEQFRVIDNKKPEKDFETKDKLQAFREGHEGAIILHKGARYLVKTQDLNKKIITVDKVPGLDYTQSFKLTTIIILKKIQTKKIGIFDLNFGVLQVIDQYNEYKIIRNNVPIAAFPLNLPPLEFRTKGIWFTISDKDKEKYQPNFESGLNGLKNAILGVYPLKCMTDHRDIGSAYKINDPDNGGATIFFYDNVAGGIGLNENAFLIFEEIIDIAKDRIKNCNCLKGCPGCIQSGKPFDNKDADKETTEKLIDLF